MKAYIGLTDHHWYQYLSAAADVDEVNFWKPGGHHVFRALKPGELFLFKLHSPYNVIVGGGIFAYANRVPITLAWDAFGTKNGACSLTEMRERIEIYRSRTAPTSRDYQIGCILLEKPFFLPEKSWLTVPRDWSRSIQQGKLYDLSAGEGKKLWDELNRAFQVPDYLEQAVGTSSSKRYGSPIEVLPRLGQGSFRVIVTDTYRRRCAVTGERTLPALEAAHIKPYSEDGPHSIDNGILLRSDIHKLFDRGYVTVTPDYHFDVSRRIREEYENGREYYALRGRELNLPADPAAWPGLHFLKWHSRDIFLG